MQARLVYSLVTGEPVPLTTDASAATRPAVSAPCSQRLGLRG